MRPPGPHSISSRAACTASVLRASSPGLMIVPSKKWWAPESDHSAFFYAWSLPISDAFWGADYDEPLKIRNSDNLIGCIKILTLWGICTFVVIYKKTIWKRKPLNWNLMDEPNTFEAVLARSGEPNRLCLWWRFFLFISSNFLFVVFVPYGPIKRCWWVFFGFLTKN